MKKTDLEKLRKDKLLDVKNKEKETLMRGIGAKKSILMANIMCIFSCPPSAGVPAKSAVAIFF